MRKLMYLIVVIVALGLIVAGCNPTVPPTGQGDIGNLTKADITVSPGESIQVAIDAANPGDTITVAPGTYYETISVTKDDLIIQSLSGNPLDTIIDGSGASHVVRIDGRSGVTLSGFTITNGVYAGVFMHTSTNCELNSIIISNLVGGDLIGLYLITLTDSSFEDIEITNIQSSRVGVGLELQAYCDRNTFTSTRVSDMTSTLGTYGIFLRLASSDNTFESSEISDLITTSGSSHAIVLWMWPNNGNEFDTTTISQISGNIAYGINIMAGQENSFSEYDISGLTGPKTYGIRINAVQWGANSNSFNFGSITGAQIGVDVLGDATLNSIHNTNIFDNTEYGAYSDVAALDATCNWWGDKSGPDGMGPGTGNAVSDNVDFSPWLLSLAPDAMCYSWEGFDEIVGCAVSAKNHGQFVSCVSHLTKDWLKDGLITAEDKVTITKWAAQSDIGKK